MLEYAFPQRLNVFVCGFPKLNFDRGKEGLGCENAISHDSGLLIYRGTNELGVLARKLDKVARTTYYVLI